MADSSPNNRATDAHALQPIPTGTAALLECCEPMANQRTTARVSFLGQVGTLALKDLRIEFRSREILTTATFFAAMVVLTFSFAFVRGDAAVAEVAPGIMWVAITFAATLGLSRAFDRERESDTMRGLLLSPVPRTAIFLGKATAIAAFITLVELVVVPLVGVIFDAGGGDGITLFAHPLPLILILVLATLGFSIVGTVFAAMLMRTRSRDVLLPVVLYPILTPLLIASTKGTAALIQQNVDGAVIADLDTAYFWIKFLCAYDAVFVVVSMWAFEALVIE